MAIALAKLGLMAAGALGLVLLSGDKKPTQAGAMASLCCKAPNGVVIICHDKQAPVLATLQSQYVGPEQRYQNAAIVQYSMSPIQGGQSVATWLAAQLRAGRVICLEVDGIGNGLLSCPPGEEVIYCPETPLKYAVLIDATGVQPQQSPGVPPLGPPPPNFPNPNAFPPGQGPLGNVPQSPDASGKPAWWPPQLPWLPGMQIPGMPPAGPQGAPQPQPQPGPPPPPGGQQAAPAWWPPGLPYPPVIPGVYNPQQPPAPQPQPQPGPPPPPGQTAPPGWPPGVPWPPIPGFPIPGYPAPPGVPALPSTPPAGQVVYMGPDGYWRHVLREGPQDYGAALSQWYTGSIAHTRELESTNPDLKAVFKPDGQFWGYSPWLPGQILKLPQGWHGEKGPPAQQVVMSSKPAGTGSTLAQAMLKKGFTSTLANLKGH